MTSTAAIGSLARRHADTNAPATLSLISTFL
eukprot:CAMPEP_0114049556 /NCGR_PEP_ID=MMETSP1339-20121228/58248_1 /TAXON_ID=94617 /ORGANISM="Fibrocapsa japonica" /LENGTH=30 /assembly_acc=CAM_ASM_000762